MKSSDSKTKNLDNQVSKTIHDWMILGAKWLLTIFVAGLLPFARMIYDDVRALESSRDIQALINKENDSKISSLKDKLKAQDKKIDDIHWFLIERNDVKVPSRNERNENNE